MKNIPLLFASMLPLTACAAQKVTTERPNILVILMDDMGYSDIGCMGSEIHTPNLDKLANNGVLFTNFYNASRSCPSRASLLTGQYQWDAGIGHMTSTHGKMKSYQGYLTNETMTIAEAAQTAGYRTFISGKWHVGDPRHQWPDKRGFEQSYVMPKGGGVYFYPSKFYKRDLYVNGQQQEPGPDWYSTDGFTDAAIDFIQQKENQKNPFMMYVAYIAPHFPLQAHPQDIAKYEGVYTKGYDAIRKERIKKQRQLGIIDKDTRVAPSEYPTWESVEDKKQEARKMQVYAAMMDCADRNIGRMIEVLKEQGLYDNTVILFLSDNGGCMSNFNKTPDVEIGGRYSNCTVGKWYNVSNTPFKLGKAKEHEGGIATPMIMHWPKGIKEVGRKITEPAHITDIMPSMLTLMDTTYPKTYKGNTLSPLDGVSFLPLVEGKKTDAKRVFCWEHEGNQAIRQNGWKLVMKRKKPWELYNLHDDPCETKNLIQKYPERAEALKVIYKEWKQEQQVMPWPLKKNQKYKQLNIE